MNTHEQNQQLIIITRGVGWGTPCATPRASRTPAARMAHRNARDYVGRILNHELPPSPPPRPSLRINPLVDAQAAGVGRGRYGIPAAGALPPQPPQRQPAGYGYYGGAAGVAAADPPLRTGADRRAQLYRPPSPSNRQVLEPLPVNYTNRAAPGAGEKPSAEARESGQGGDDAGGAALADLSRRFGGRVDAVEDAIGSLVRALGQCRADLQREASDKRSLGKELEAARGRIQVAEIARMEAARENQRLNERIDRLLSEVEGHKLEMQTFKSHLLGDSALLEKLREAAGDTVQVTAEQIATLNGRVGDVMRNVQLLTQQAAEEAKQRRALEQEAQILRTNTEASLVQSESNVLRRVLSVVEGQSKELLRKHKEGAATAEERHGAQRAAMEEQWRIMATREAQDKKTIIERMLVLERALREEHESRLAAESAMRGQMEQRDAIALRRLESTKASSLETVEHLRGQLAVAFQRMEEMVVETDRRNSAKLNDLEDIVKLEVAARMKSFKKVNGLCSQSVDEVRQLNDRIDKLQASHSQVEDSIADLVVGEVSNNLIETSLHELLVEDLEQQLEDTKKDVDHVKAVVGRLEGFNVEESEKAIGSIAQFKSQLDAFKSVQEASKKRQENNLQQIRSEQNLNKITSQLRMDELQQKIDSLSERINEITFSQTE